MLKGYKEIDEMAYMKTFPEGRHVKECVQRVLALRKISENK